MSTLRKFTSTTVASVVTATALLIGMAAPSHAATTPAPAVTGVGGSSSMTINQPNHAATTPPAPASSTSTEQGGSSSTSISRPGYVVSPPALSAPVGTPNYAATTAFKDISGSPFKKDILWMAETGVATPYADGTYRPYAAVSRGAMADFLYRMAGSPAYTAPAKSRFVDVKPGHPLYKEIHWLAAQGITTGYGDKTFQPETAVNRGSMAAFLFRFAGKPAYAAPVKSEFKDVKTGQGFYKEIHWLKAKGITTGYGDKTFRTNSAVSREAMAAFLHRLQAGATA